MTAITSFWILMSFVGLAFALWDMASAYGHYTLVKQGWPEHDRLMEFTKMTLTAQSARALLLGIFLVIGINAMSSNDRGLFIGLMFLANGVTVYASVRSHFFRERLFKKERAEIEKKTNPS